MKMNSQVPGDFVGRIDETGHLARRMQESKTRYAAEDRPPDMRACEMDTGSLLTLDSSTRERVSDVELPLSLIGQSEFENLVAGETLFGRKRVRSAIAVDLCHRGEVRLSRFHKFFGRSLVAEQRHDLRQPMMTVA